MTKISDNRTFSSPTGIQSIGEQATEFYNYRGHNAKIALSYTINNRQQLTLTGNLIKGRTPDGEMTGTNHFSQGQGSMADSILIREQDMVSTRTMQNYSLNYLGKLDTLGKQIEFIATFTPIKSNDITQMRFQEMRLPNGALLNELPVIQNDNRMNAHIWVAQVDATLPFGNDLRLNVGSKLSSSRNSSETLQSERVGMDWQLMPEWGFDNRLYEDILAAYAEGQTRFGNTLVKLGLRAENTMMGVREVYERRFFSLFPNAMIQQDLGNRKLTFNYRRTIARPGFSQMTPFRLYLNEVMVIEGNPNLKPRYAHQFTLNGELISDLFMELAYIRERDLTMQLPRQEGEVTVYAPVNMDGSEWSANLSYNRQLTSWWDINGYGRAFRYAYEGTLNGYGTNGSGYSFNIGLSSSLRLPAQFAIEASYSYYAPYGYTWRTNYARVAFRKNLIQKRAQIILAFNDIFMGQRYRSETELGNLYLFNTNYSDTQRISLGFTWNFGKNTVKAASDKKLGNEDVINRAN